MAEAGDLKSSQCGFESHLGHRSVQALIGAEVQVLVQAAARIEGRAAGGARVSAEVVPDPHRLLADAAQDRLGILLPRRPNGCCVVSCFCVAEVAWIELAAAFELDGDHVEHRPVVNATGLVINCRAEDSHSASNGAA